MLRPAFAIATTLATLLLGDTAQAHISLIQPAPRTSQQKEGPCGTTGLARGDTVAVFEPGETITVMWDETVNHTSHYRIAFDLEGDDDLIPPDGRDDLYNSAAVLSDGIGDASGGRYTQEVTLPDEECERCVLQLIQVMYGSGNYFQCADIAIRRSGTEEPPGMMEDDAGSPMAEDAGAPPQPDASQPPPPTSDAGTRPMPSPGPALDDAPSGHVTGGCSVAPRAHDGEASGALPLFAIGLVLAIAGPRRGRRFGAHRHHGHRRDDGRNRSSS